MIDADELLTIDEVADVLKIGRTKVYQLIERGELSSITIDRCRRIPRSAVNAFIGRKLQAVAHAYSKVTKIVNGLPPCRPQCCDLRFTTNVGLL